MVASLHFGAAPLQEGLHRIINNLLPSAPPRLRVNQTPRSPRRVNQTLRSPPFLNRNEKSNQGNSRGGAENAESWGKNRPLIHFGAAPLQEGLHRIVNNLLPSAPPRLRVDQTLRSPRRVVRTKVELFRCGHWYHQILSPRRR